MPQLGSAVVCAKLHHSVFENISQLMLKNNSLTKGIFFFPNLTYGSGKCKQNRILIFCCLFNVEKKFSSKLASACSLKFCFRSVVQPLMIILCSLQIYIQLWAGKKCPCHSNDIQCQMICQNLPQSHSKYPGSQWELDWAMESVSICA